MAIVIDSRMKKIIKVFTHPTGDVSVNLNDIDETFWFKNKTMAQIFLTEQSTERFADKSLRKGYFDYIDEYDVIHRYNINEVLRGKIISFEEKIVA